MLMTSNRLIRLNLQEKIVFDSRKFVPNIQKGSRYDTCVVAKEEAADSGDAGEPKHVAVLEEVHVLPPRGGVQETRGTPRHGGQIDRHARSHQNRDASPNPISSSAGEQFAGKNKSNPPYLAKMQAFDSRIAGPRRGAGPEDSRSGERFQEPVPSRGKSLRRRRMERGATSI